jgi:hypothetical protein
MLSLRELQLRFSAALTPGAADVDPVLSRLVRGQGELDATARLRIYADMYRARLVDVLREDFPRTAAVAGDEAFEALACRYLQRCPSTHPSVRHLGRRLAAFVAGDWPDPPWLADLARLEWARVEVFDAPDAEPLTLDDLRAVAPADWPTLRFRPIPACEVVETAWPVHQVWSANGTAADMAPTPTTMRVWREGFSVSHAAMGDVERRVFPLLRRGEPFAALCAAADTEGDPEAAAREVGALLMRWLDDQLLTRSIEGSP